MTDIFAVTFEVFYPKMPGDYGFINLGPLFQGRDDKFIFTKGHISFMVGLKELDEQTYTLSNC